MKNQTRTHITQQAQNETIWIRYVDEDGEVRCAHADVCKKQAEKLLEEERRKHREIVFKNLKKHDI